MKYLTLLLAFLMITLEACNSPVSAAISANALAVDDGIANSTQVNESLAESAQDAGSQAATVDSLAVELSDSFADALSLTGQLAVGTVQLEDSDLAVAEEQAVELLPLWEALQALSQSDMTAEVELAAVVKQIQETMTPQQIQAIANMELTNKSLDEMQSSGALAMGGFGMRSEDNAGSFEMPSGGGMGGPPGGDGEMGGPPAGGGDPGGAPDGGLGMIGNVNENGTVTLDEGSMQVMMLANMVIRFLQTKTGERPAFGPDGGGDARTAAMAVIGKETGLALPDIQSELASGKSLPEITADSGGDLEAVKSAVQEALADMPLPQDQDQAAFIDELLNGTR